MTLATEVKKITDSKPFYAITGAGDFAVEKLRELPDQLTKLQAKRGEARAYAATVQSKAEAYAATVQGKAETYAKDLPEKTKEYADVVSAKLSDLYEELATRGRKVVSKVSGEAALELEEVSESAEPAIAAKPAPKTTPAKRTTTPRAKATTPKA